MSKECSHTDYDILHREPARQRGDCTEVIGWCNDCDKELTWANAWGDILIDTYDPHTGDSR